MITNLKVEKDRNYLIFSDGDKQVKTTWKYDLNTATIIGVKGNAITRVPSGWKTAINDKCSDVRLTPFERHKETDYFLFCIWDGLPFSVSKLSLVEKAFSANWFKNFSPICINKFLVDIRYMEEDRVTFIHDHFSQMKHAYREGIASSEYFSINSAVQAAYISMQYSEYQKYIDKYGIDITTYVVDHIQDKKMLKYVWNWLNDDTLEVLDACHIFPIDYYHYSNNTLRWATFFVDVLNKATALGLIPSKGHALLECALILRDFKTHQEKMPTITLKANQKEEWGMIEDDNFAVVVPTTLKELQQEGSAMRNCVGDYWCNNYGNKLKQGKQQRGVVFIRRKTQLNKPYIDCDFDLSTREIRQALAPKNATIKDLKALKFIEKFQKYLYSLI